MKMEEKKEFSLLENGDLKVKVDTEDDLFIPVEKENKVVGSFTQTTYQLIKKDNVTSLWEFILQNKELAENQLINVNKEIESLKRVPNVLPKEFKNKVFKGMEDLKEAKDNLLDLVNKFKAENVNEKYVAQIREMVKDILKNTSYIGQIAEHIKKVEKKESLPVVQRNLAEQISKINKDYNALKSVLGK